jgi:hypothetical protein
MGSTLVARRARRYPASAETAAMVRMAAPIPSGSTADSPKRKLLIQRVAAIAKGSQKAIQHFYRLARQPSAARVEKMAGRWPGWRSYFTYYLWLTYWEGQERKAGLLRKLRSR